MVCWLVAQTAEDSELHLAGESADHSAALLVSQTVRMTAGHLAVCSADRMGKPMAEQTAHVTVAQTVSTTDAK